MASDQPTVALVHGCTQGPSGWDRVRDLLSGSGVRSVAVDLDPRDFDGTTALECASHIARVLENHARVILVGTSCAGIIIPVVTMFRPVDHLVFVCAGLPDIGRSATDQIFNDGLLHDDWLHYSGEPDSPEAATRFMFNDCDGDVLTWSLSTVRLFMPQPAYDEVTPLAVVARHAVDLSPRHQGPDHQSGMGSSGRVRLGWDGRPSICRRATALRTASPRRSRTS